MFSHNKLGRKHLNFLYNSADVQILCTSNEGWGLTLTEGMLTGTPIIANVKGGMQDQMRFIDENGKWFTPSPDVPSNHRGTYKKHGKWVLPVYPSNSSIVGSPATPYIFDSRCKNNIMYIFEYNTLIEARYNCDNQKLKQHIDTKQYGFTFLNKFSAIFIEKISSVLSVFKREFNKINT